MSRSKAAEPAVAQASHRSAGTFLEASRYLGFRQRWTLLLAALGLAVTVTEAGGLILLLPIFEFIQADGDVGSLAANSPVWEKAVNLAQGAGLEVNLILLMATAMSLILLRQVFAYYKAVTAQTVLERTVRGVRNKGVTAYFHMAAEHQEQLKMGVVINTLTTETGGAGSAMTSPSRILGIVIVAAIYLGTLGALSIPLTLVTLCLGALLGLILFPVVRYIGRAGTQRLRAADDLARLLARRLRSSRLVRICGSEAIESEEIHEQARKLEQRSLGITRARTHGDVIVEPVIAAFGLGLLYFATQGYGMSLGQIGLFLAILLRLSPVVRGGAAEVNLLAASLPALYAVASRIRAWEEAREKDTGALEFPGIEQDICFEDVAFRYPSRTDYAVRGINMRIRRGELIVLVGPSGSGKSTLVDLLFRLQDPLEGQILVDGKPITEFSRSSLRRKIAYVPQAAQIIDETIANHVAYGNTGATNADIEEALKLSGAAEFVRSLPEGAQTELTEGGSGLSGGQLQRLELARGMARNADVLVLDEPTSHLDHHSETAFWRTIESLHRRGDCTIIVIAHRLTLARSADRIFVIQNGRIKEHGSHEDLMAINGWYQTSWRRQQENEPLPAASPSR